MLHWGAFFLSGVFLAAVSVSGEGPFPPPQIQVRLSTPPGFSKWFLFDSTRAALGCYVHPRDNNVCWLPTDETAEYSPGAVAVVLSTVYHSRKECLDTVSEPDNGDCYAYEVRITSGPDKGKHGFVATDLLEVTKESQALRVSWEAAAARRAREEHARRELEQAAARAERNAERERARKACATVYSKTIDRKISDLTVRETTQVNACQSRGWYLPPNK